MSKANNALRKLDLNELRQVFDNLMQTSRIFWDLIDYIIENDECSTSSTIAYEYMINKLLNDCPEKEILNEIQNF